MTDADGAQRMLDEAALACLPALKRAWADSAYRGKLAEHLHDKHSRTLEIVTRDKLAETPAATEPEAVTRRGFKPLHWRWIVERTFGWIGRYRRMSKDYERKASSSAGWMLLGMTRLMAARLAGAP